MRRLIHSALAVIFLATALAEPVVALQATHACCHRRPAAPAEKPSCHGHPGARSASVSESHSGTERPDRCCLGAARLAARPESPSAWAVALHRVSAARAAEFHPLHSAELQTHSGRAPPSRLPC